MEKITLIDKHEEGTNSEIIRTAIELEDGTIDWILGLGDDAIREEYKTSFNNNKIEIIVECYEAIQGYEVESNTYKNLTQFLQVNQSLLKKHFYIKSGISTIIEIVKKELHKEEVYLEDNKGGMEHYIRTLEDSDTFYNEASTLGSIYSLKKILDDIDGIVECKNSDFNNTSIKKTLTIEKILCVALLDINVEKLSKLGFYGQDIKQAIDYATQYLQLNKINDQMEKENDNKESLIKELHEISRNWDELNLNDADITYYPFELSFDELISDINSKSYQYIKEVHLKITNWIESL